MHALAAWIVDVGGDKKARPLFAGSTLAGKAGYNGDGLSAAWAPDGESVVFAAADSADALLVWPDENHWITKGENSRYREVRSWLEKYLLAAPARPQTTPSGR